MLTIPLIAKPNQTLAVTLAGQTCKIDVYQVSTGMFLDLYVNDVLILGGTICRIGILMVRTAYLGFVGDLAFVDTQGSADPVYTGLNSRWFLEYLEASDLA